MIPKIFVSATNTNVGKTYAMEQLIDAFSVRGLKVGVFKPIETGVINKPVDAQKIFELAKRHNPALFALTLDDICPYQFELPAAPFVAKGDQVIEMTVILNALKKIEELSDIVLIEGAGGLLVPVEEDQKMVDLALLLANKLLLVVPSRLGSINDTLLNLELLKGYDIAFEWVINLFEDKADFDRVTKPYYRVKFPDYKTLQGDLDKVVERLLQ